MRAVGERECTGTTKAADDTMDNSTMSRRTMLTRLLDGTDNERPQTGIYERQGGLRLLRASNQLGARITNQFGCVGQAN